MGLTASELDIIKDRLRAEGASYVAVFGSYARDEETPESDVDILVEFTDAVSLFDIARIERELGDELGKPVELVTEPSLSPHIRDRVLADSEVLLA